MASPFTRKALAFLRALQRNNDREWLRARKADDEGTRCGLCTRGGVLKRKRFYYRWDGQSLHIHRESGWHDEFPVSEIAHILKRLDDQFTAGWFPLANNVEKLSNGTEKAGLGQTILQGQPGNVIHAQASSYVGVVLEDLGLATWNGLNKGIQWRLIRKPPGAEELARLITRRVSDVSPKHDEVR